jgi:hypothetical protein
MIYSIEIIKDYDYKNTNFIKIDSSECIFQSKIASGNSSFFDLSQ